ncbi:sec7 domain-containing protein [Hirsutella rhossiliensis]|uniref:Sec7 domain-containing protein n=1 Tax=Hirsutella rhossiliensis TaxID=111463 RepID=A0A9P8N051_9HYPO|nr:sec7 domain-containing protein [Hirsutella rhossiliensis]KAH0964419.1 sec7 domain-containing protein [Hirsutella rhossiliensis]
MASETDMRRLNAAAPRASDDNNPSNADDDSDSGAPLASALSAQQPLRQQQRRPPPIALPDAASPQPPSRESAQAEQESNKHRRFSVLRFRNASDSQLSLRAKQQAERPPPVPRPPAIVTTAPTNEITGPKKMSSRMSLAAKFRRSNDIPRRDDDDAKNQPRQPPRASFTEDRGRPSLATLTEPRSPSPGPNGAALDASNKRQSDSSKSDASSVDHVSHPSPSSTIRKPQSSTPFFKLRRGKRAPEQLFPMAHLPQKNAAQPASASSTSLGAGSTPRPSSARSATTPRARTDRHEDGHSSPTRAHLLRERSSTMSSMGRESTDDHLLPPTTRTSTSTGRKSFGDLFGLSRIRQNSELSRQGSLTPATPGSITSKSNSLQLSRGSIVLPERRDDESPAKYLARLEEVVSRGLIASAVSKGTDPFTAAVLRSYMRKFSFFGDPMDMALRKLLMEAELPKETQQIDRCLQAFANRYHECNPGIYSSPDQAYFIAFSQLILHTDVFNKNNKHKMQKSDYLKNTRGEGIFDEILECFYDNISYTPFIHVEDEIDLNSERNATNKRKKKKQLFSANPGDPAKRAIKEPIDPYTLIMDGNLDALRPNLKDAMSLDDHYTYLGTSTSLNLRDLQKTFFRTGVLQIVSARSRPDAFMSEKTATNPAEAHPGIVDIKITKVGLLWRKEIKRRKTRSPWQEWGAILTGAQLYFFQNTSWIKNLMHQYENHLKAGHDGIPIIFKPPLEEFKPDALMSTQGAVALVDTTYKKHKNAFVYVRQGGLDEVLLADNEEERNDWLAKLNYAAAFRTSGVRMRGVVGGHYDGQGRRGMRRLDSSDATQLIQTPTGPVSIARGRIDHKMAQDIQTARRDGLQQKITEADRKVEDAQKRLEEHLRNARHLQILAPIQPRTRESLLLAAARMAAQLKWTRMEIWKETCHRDILVQDLAEDRPTSASTATPTKAHVDTEQRASPIPRPLSTHLENNSDRHSATESSPQTPANLNTSRFSSATEAPHEAESSSKQTFQTPPPSAIKSRRESHDPSQTASDTGSTRHGQDEVDADERDFLKQTGLWEARSGRVSIDKITDRDKVDRSKIRRSLQRTLREGAGHLPHHRGRKGKDVTTAGAFEDGAQDIMLTRGTGSFVVHGKKASVINLGTELQSMSQDDKVFARKQQQQAEQPIGSPVQSAAPDDVFLSGHEASPEPPQEHEQSDRRESTTSAGTATARSFRELHRRYSSAQAARSVSAGGRLAIPSDGESEAAVSFSDGRRSPQPLVEKGAKVEAEEPLYEVRRDQVPQEKREKDSGTADEELPLEPGHLSKHPIQPVNA